MKRKFFVIFKKDGNGASTGLIFDKNEAIEKATELVRKAGSPYYIVESVMIVKPKVTEMPVEYVDIKLEL